MKRMFFIGYLSFALAACSGPKQHQRSSPSPRQTADIRARSADAFAELEAAERGEPSTMPRQEVERDLEKKPVPAAEPPPKPYKEKPVEQVQVNPSREPPDWVNNQPNMPGYYLGIGVSTNHGDEAADWARARTAAYTELASTLKVHINSVIVDYFKENNLRLYKGDSIEKDVSRQDSSYSNDAHFFVDQTLEGVEIYDRWKDTKQVKYWMLVRLSKEEIARRLRERIEKAQKKALDYTRAAVQAEQAGRIGEAFAGYFKAYLALREFFGGIVEYDLNGDGKPEMLNHEIERAVNRLCQNLNWEAREPNRRAVVGSGLSDPLTLRVTCGGNPVANLPVEISFQRGTGTVEQHVTTDDSGTAAARLVKIFGQKQAILAGRLDVGALVENKDQARTVLAKFESDINLKTGKFFIELQELSAFIDIQEENLGREVQPGSIAADIREILHRELGLVFTSTDRGADLTIKGVASTGECGDFMNQRMCKARVNVTVADRTKGKELFSKQFTISGNAENDEQAGRDALKKAGPRIANKIIEQFK
jgi:hypothetical protein